MDHVVLVDPSRSPASIYDSAYNYPVIFSSTSLLYCVSPDAVKAKVTSSCQVVRMRKTCEEPKNSKRKLLPMSRGD